MATIDSYIWYLYATDLNRFNEAARIITDAIRNPNTSRFSIHPDPMYRKRYIASIYNIPQLVPTNNDPKDSVLNLLAMFVKDYDIILTHTLGDVIMPYGQHIGKQVKMLPFNYMMGIAKNYTDTSHYAVDTKAEILARLCTMTQDTVKAQYLKYTEEQISNKFEEVYAFFN